MRTLEGEWIGVKYETREYFEALEKAEGKFNKEFCKIYPEDHRTCLDRFEHDGQEEDNIKYAVGLYCLGECSSEFDLTKKDDIEIGLITDGKDTTGWFLKGESYEKGLKKERQF